jgi:flavorubredoxin
LKKIIKIVLVVFLALVIVGISFFALVMGDVAGNMATGTHPLPNGAATGKAIIVYDPGLTGGAKDIATKIGYNLQEKGYDVLLAGVKSSAAGNLAEYNVVVVGGPIYAGKPASTIETYLNNLQPPANAKVGVFGFGSVKIDNSNATSVMQDVAPLPSSSQVTVNAVLKVTSSDNTNSLCSEFVTNLIK